MRWVVIFAQVLALTALAAPSVGAEPLDDASKGAARNLGYEGVEYFQRGDFAGAAERLERAYEVLRAPSLGLWSARALEKTGKLVEAAERYLEVTRLEVSSGEAAVQKQAQAEAATEREALLPRLPNLVLKIAGAERSAIQCTVNGVAVPSALLGVRRPMNPGAHRIEARLGAQTKTEEVTLREAETKEITLKFDAAPIAAAPPTEPAPGAGPTPGPAPLSVATTPAVSSTQRTLGFVALGVGGAALIGGGVTTVLALNKRSSIAEQCPNDNCLPAAHDDADTYNSMRTISTVALVGGAVLGGAGVVLLLTAPSNREGAQVSAWVNASSAGISGSF